MEKTFQTALAAFNASSKKVKHFSEEANKYTFTQETRDNLKNPSFDSWLWEENEMSSLLELMFVELGLIEEFKISIPTLRRFIKAAKDNYNDNVSH